MDILDGIQVAHLWILIGLPKCGYNPNSSLYQNGILPVTFQLSSSVWFTDSFDVLKNGYEKITFITNYEILPSGKYFLVHFYDPFPRTNLRHRFRP